MDKLQLTGQNLGRVFNFRSGHLHALTILVLSVKLPSLQLKNQPKQLLGSLPLVITLPALADKSGLKNDLSISPDTVVGPSCHQIRNLPGKFGKFKGNRIIQLLNLWPNGSIRFIVVGKIVVRQIVVWPIVAAPKEGSKSLFC